MKVYHKFHAKRTEADGISFDSKKEAQYYNDLKLRVRAGEVVFFLMQVPFLLPGNVRYRCDFMEFWTDGTVHFVDVKGMRLRSYIDKKKMVESLYPITIEEG